jgi:hypothetical protein
MHRIRVMVEAFLLGLLQLKYLWEREEQNLACARQTISLDLFRPCVLEVGDSKNADLLKATPAFPF